MEKFISKSGRALAKWRSGINFFLEEKVQNNSTNLILFILSVFVFFILSFSLIFGLGSITENYPVFLILFLIMALVLIWLAIFYESNKYLETQRHDFGLIPLKKLQVRFEVLLLIP
jgi:glucan phosphoethanolaminetransferase (alkaline phosphatase superfamily)